MGSAYEVKVVSVEEFGDNVSSKSEADSAVILTPPLKIRIWICYQKHEPRVFQISLGRQVS